MKTTYLMDVATDTVDTKENWLAEMSTWDVNKDGLTPEDQFNLLIEVVKDENGDWIEF